MPKGGLKLMGIKKIMNYLKGFAVDEDGLAADPILPFIFGMVFVIVITIVANVA